MSTKTALQKQVRSRLSEWVSSKPRTTDDIEWVRELLNKQEHWKLKTCRVSAVRSIKKRGCIYLQVMVDPCKRWCTVSWKASCGSVSTCASPLFSAMRNSIKRQVSMWKSSHFLEKSCTRCLVTTCLQADHVTSFIQIARAFTEHWQLPAPTQFDCRACKGFFFKKTDVAYAHAFQAYHRSRATFQWLCKSCNCSKGAKVADCVVGSSVHPIDGTC
jgi:hypothetical protein